MGRVAGGDPQQLVALVVGTTHVAVHGELLTAVVRADARTVPPAGGVVRELRLIDRRVDLVRVLRVLGGVLRILLIRRVLDGRVDVLGHAGDLIDERRVHGLLDRDHDAADRVRLVGGLRRVGAHPAGVAHRGLLVVRLVRIQGDDGADLNEDVVRVPLEDAEVEDVIGLVRDDQGRHRDVRVVAAGSRRDVGRGGVPAGAVAPAGGNESEQGDHDGGRHEG